MSEVWKVFKKTQRGLRAKCLICKNTYSNGNTSNLWRHLRCKHEQKFIELVNLTKGFSGSSSLVNNIDEVLISSTQTKIDNALAYFISTDMMPYNIVTKDGFKMYTNAINPGYKIPSPEKMKLRILYLYKMTKVNVEAIAKTTIFMSFTTDCWTSIANQPFMALTGHYIDTNFNLGSICLGCIELTEEHTGDMGDELIMLLSEYDIEIPSKKICSFTTDNGSNVLKAVENLHINHVPCFGHVFNTAVGKIFLLPEVDKVVEKVKEIQSIVVHNWQAVRDFKIKQEQFNLNQSEFPSYSKTMWWTLLDLIKVVITQELALSSFLHTYKEGEHKKLIIDAEQFEVLKCIEIVLNPLREIADNLTGETYVTASAIYPVIHNIKQKLNEVSTNENVTQLKDKMYDTILNLFDTCYNDNNALKISMVLDPRFNMKYINETDQISVKNDIKIECVSAWMLWNELYGNKEGGTDNLSTDNHSPPKKMKSGLFSIFGEPNDQNELSSNQVDDKTMMNNIQKEIDSYTGLPTVPFCQNPLKWWNLNSSMYPFLTILAKKFLTIQATSIAPERVFSKRGHEITGYRATLTNDHTNQLVFLSANKVHVSI